MTLIGRYAAHAFVLVIAVALSTYATVSRHVPAAAGLRLASVNPQGLLMGEGGEVDNISLGRMSTIIPPPSAPTAGDFPHTPLSYTVRDGEDLKAIAAKFNLDGNYIRWSNLPKLKNTDRVSPGDQLVIPPIPGVVVTVDNADTLQNLVASYHGDAAATADFNYLRDPSNLLAGTQLVIPAGQGPALFPRSVSTGPPRLGGYANGKFSYGYCTWYVASRRPVPWTGDAWAWYGGSRALGFATGKTPEPGAIMVTWESPVGHVAYVETVNADGSFVVSEMNYRGWDIVSTRTLRPNQVPLIGFIY